MESNIAWKSGANGARMGPTHIYFDSQQLGIKFGKHMSDYPGYTHTSYQAYAEDVFANPDSIIYDAEKNEYYYIHGNDLLRVSPDGYFISLYPGANSNRVKNANK